MIVFVVVCVTLLSCLIKSRTAWRLLFLRQATLPQVLRHVFCGRSLRSSIRLAVRPTDLTQMPPTMGLSRQARNHQQIDQLNQRNDDLYSSTRSSLFNGLRRSFHRDSVHYSPFSSVNAISSKTYHRVFECKIIMFFLYRRCRIPTTLL